MLATTMNDGCCSSGWSWGCVYGLWTGLVLVSRIAAAVGYKLMSAATPAAEGGFAAAFPISWVA